MIDAGKLTKQIVNERVSLVRVRMLDGTGCHEQTGKLIVHRERVCVASGIDGFEDFLALDPIGETAKPAEPVLQEGRSCDQSVGCCGGRACATAETLFKRLDSWAARSDMSRTQLTSPNSSAALRSRLMRAMSRRTHPLASAIFAIVFISCANRSFVFRRSS